MGFDIYGKKEDTYFRANIWSWPSILSLIAQTEILPQNLVTEMGSNNGAAVNGGQSLKLADALENLITDKDDMDTIRSSGTNCSTSQMGLEFMKTLQQGGTKIITPSEPVFGIEIWQIKRFIHFCRNSGGFKVC